MEPVKRKSLRVEGYDYSCNGYSFITICTKHKQKLFWESVGATIGRPQLSPLGCLVDEALNQLSFIYPHVLIDKYVIMPNHVHFILVIKSLPIIDGRPMAAPTLSRIIQQMKGYVSKRAGFPVWQKSYYDHIIRNDEDYLNTWTYIDTNPRKRKEDIYYHRGT